MSRSRHPHSMPLNFRMAACSITTMHFETRVQKSPLRRTKTTDPSFSKSDTNLYVLLLIQTNFQYEDTLVRVLDNDDDGRMKNMRACETDVQRREQQSIHVFSPSSASTGLQRITSVLCQLSIGCSRFVPYVENVQMIEGEARVCFFLFFSRRSIHLRYRHQF